jgi:hypothetical protein
VIDDRRGRNEIEFTFQIYECEKHGTQNSKEAKLQNSGLTNDPPFPQHIGTYNTIPPLYSLYA